MTKFSSYILGFFKQGAALQTLFRVPQPPLAGFPCSFSIIPCWGRAPKPHSSFSFWSPERKPKQKKEHENVLSSEADCIFFQITQ